MTTTATLSGAVLDRVRDPLDAITRHEWVRAFRDNRLPAALVGYWANLDIPFCHAEKGLLEDLLAIPGIPPILAGVFRELRDDCIREPRMFEDIMRRTGTRPSGPPAEAAAYIEFMRDPGGPLDEGGTALLTGTTKLIVAEGFYEKAFACIGGGYPAGGEYADVVGNWDADRFTGINRRLRAGADLLAAPSEEVMAELGPVADQGARGETRFLDACLAGPR